MKRELDEKLVKEFPLLYADRNASIRETAMCWGFECGDGWFDIIWDLSSKIEPLIQAYIDDNDNALCKSSHPRASQVKEKFGGLRFYMTDCTDEMRSLIDHTEDLSYSTCETCGQPGTVRRTGWISILCDACNEKKTAVKIISKD